MAAGLGLSLSFFFFTARHFLLDGVLASRIMEEAPWSCFGGEPEREGAE